jgi:TetR/AcrR family transcriptional regulator, mexJK operon transcriptional repressor
LVITQRDNERKRLIERLRSLSTDGNKRYMGKRLAHRPVDQEKQAAILVAARAEFFEHGYAGASIERIAASAGVSKVTIYNHFQNKENLFSHMIGQECSRMRVELADLGPQNDDLRHSLLGFSRSMMDFLSSPDIIRFERRLAAEVEHYPAMGELFLNAGPRRLRAMLTQLIETAMAKNQLASADPDLAAGHLYGILKGFSDIEWRFADANSADSNAPSVEAAVDRFLLAYAR